MTLIFPYLRNYLNTQLTIIKQKNVPVESRSEIHIRAYQEYQVLIMTRYRATDTQLPALNMSYCQTIMDTNPTFITRETCNLMDF